MQYTDDYRMKVISEVYKETKMPVFISTPIDCIEKCCEIVAKDLDMSVSVVLMWVKKYRNNQLDCFIKAIYKKYGLES